MKKNRNLSAESSPKRISTIFRKVIAILLTVALWEIGAAVVRQPLLLCGPIDVIKRLGELILQADFWRSIMFSLCRVALGFGAGLLSGVLLGFCAGKSETVETLLHPVMTAVKSVPVASFIILSLIWFSAKQLSAFISFLIVLPVIYTNVSGAFRNTDKKLSQMARVFRVSGVKKLFYIELTQVMPSLFSACAVSLGMAWKAGIAAEVIGLPAGSIGERLYQAKIYFDTADLFAWTAAIVLTSYVFEKLTLFMLKKIYGLFVGR